MDVLRDRATSTVALRGSQELAPQGDGAPRAKTSAASLRRIANRNVDLKAHLSSSASHSAILFPETTRQDVDLLVLLTLPVCGLLNRDDWVRLHSSPEITTVIE
jgi:hypothetical protein